jgi:hypothetical protein
MTKAILAIFVLGSTIFLSAFGPPRLQSKPAQQTGPKTWIPEAKPETPLTTPPEAPPAPTPPAVTPPDLLTHAPIDMRCDAPSSRPREATKAFVESYSAAIRALDDRRYIDALTNAEKAAKEAAGSSQWGAIEQLRVAAFAGLDDPAHVLTTIDTVVAQGCAPAAILRNYRDMRPGLRAELGLRPE